MQLHLLLEAARFDLSPLKLVIDTPHFIRASLS
jgi:hypothetical protein